MRIQAKTGHWEITKPQEPGAHADPSKDGPLGNDKTTGVQAGAHMEPSGGHGDKDTEAGNATGHGDPSRSPYRSK